MSCDSFLALKNLAGSSCNIGDSLAMTPPCWSSASLMQHPVLFPSWCASANNKHVLSSPGGILTLQRWSFLQTCYCSPEHPLDPGRQLPGIPACKWFGFSSLQYRPAGLQSLKNFIKGKLKLLCLVVLLIYLPYSPWSIVCINIYIHTHTLLDF